MTNPVRWTGAVAAGHGARETMRLMSTATKLRAKHPRRSSPYSPVGGSTAQAMPAEYRHGRTAFDKTMRPVVGCNRPCAMGGWLCRKRRPARVYRPRADPADKLNPVDSNSDSPKRPMELDERLALDLLRRVAQRDEAAR